MTGAAETIGQAVSAVIPTYNHARFLPFAIDSALQQDYAPLEVIVVDDGSTDETPDVLRRYGARIRVVRQANAGLSAARNAGIRAAGGRCVAFLDADDAWRPGFVSRAMACLARDEALGAVYAGFEAMDVHGHPLPQIGVDVVPDKALYDRLLDGEFFVPSAVVARRSCFDAVGMFDEALRASEDWDMWLRVARAFPVRGIPEPLVRYRVHGSNMSGNPDHMLHFQLMVVEKHFGHADGPPDTWPAGRQRAQAAVHRYAVQGYYLGRRLDEARAHLRQALEANPALCESVEMFYELGCADQPLGQRTIAAAVDVEKNGAFILETLQEIFAAPDRPARLRGLRGRAEAHAAVALAKLAYGTGRLALARRYLLRALARDLRLGLRADVLGALAKTLLGARVLGGLRAWRRAGGEQQP